MASPPPLSPILLAQLPEQQRASAAATDLEQQLTQLVAEARETWPEIELPVEAFLAYLARRLPREQEVQRGLRGLRTGDLYIACACARGDVGAMTALEGRYFSIIDAALGRLRVASTTLDDVKQTLREQLFVGPAGGSPMIESYSGRGQLRRWLRIIAVRSAFRRFGLEEREVPLEEEAIDELMPPSGDVELEYLKRAYRREFKAAFGEALTSLTSRERVLLQQHYVDRLSIDRLCRVYRVHRATAARWLVRARETLLARTRDALMQQLQLSEEGCDSIFRLIESQLDVTLPSFLSGE